VTSVTSAFTLPDRSESAAARFTPLGRAAAAGTIVAGALFQVLAFALIPDFDRTIDRLHWIAAHDTRAELSKTFDLLAVPFLLGAVIVYVLLGRERSPRLAWAGGILLGLGMCGLMAVQGFETLEFALAADGRIGLAPLGDVVDNVSTAPAIAMAVIFLAGAALGLLVTSASLWRSRAVPRAAAILLVVFFVIDAPLSQPLAGHLVALVAAVWIAASILRARAR
jgi:hypothetical protein